MLQKALSNNDEELVEEYYTAIYEAKKVSKNSKTHKKRLGELSKNDDFN